MAVDILVLSCSKHPEIERFEWGYRPYSLAASTTYEKSTNGFIALGLYFLVLSSVYMQYRDNAAQRPTGFDAVIDQNPDLLQQIE